MTTLFLTTLFAFSAAFAVAAIVGTWRTHAATILSLRQQMNECAELRDFRYSLKTVEVRSLGATIHRADFRASRRPLREEQPLRAAA